MADRCRTALCTLPNLFHVPQRHNKQLAANQGIWRGSVFVQAEHIVSSAKVSSSLLFHFMELSAVVAVHAVDILVLQCFCLIRSFLSIPGQLKYFLYSVCFVFSHFYLFVCLFLFSFIAYTFLTAVHVVLLTGEFRFYLKSGFV